MAAPTTASSSYMPTMAMLKSGLVTAAVAAGSYALVGKQVSQMAGLNEYAGVFLGLGVSSVIGPMVLAYVDSMQMPPMPAVDSAMLKTFAYGGAVGTAVYYVFNMIYPDLADVYDVAISAVAAGSLGPYLSLPSY